MPIILGDYCTDFTTLSENCLHSLSLQIYHPRAVAELSLCRTLHLDLARLIASKYRFYALPCQKIDELQKIFIPISNLSILLCNRLYNDASLEYFMILCTKFLQSADTVQDNFLMSQHLRDSCDKHHSYVAPISADHWTQLYSLIDLVRDLREHVICHFRLQILYGIPLAREKERVLIKAGLITQEEIDFKNEMNRYIDNFFSHIGRSQLSLTKHSYILIFLPRFMRNFLHQHSPLHLYNRDMSAVISLLVTYPIIPVSVAHNN